MKLFKKGEDDGKDKSKGKGMTKFLNVLNPAVMVETVVGIPSTLAQVTKDMAGMTTGDRRKSVAVKKNPHQRLRNIFAVPMSFISDAVDVAMGEQSKGLPHFSHTPEEIEFLTEKLKEHYLFESLSSRDLGRLVSAFEPVKYPEKEENTTLIRQGEVVTPRTGYFYIIQRGSCEYVVDGKVVGDEAMPGDCFGELALLYNCPRAATVNALTKKHPVKLFRVHQNAFRQLLRSRQHEDDKAKMELLEALDFTKSLTSYQRSKLAALMKARVFEKGEKLLAKGESVECWMVIEKGEILITNIAKPSGDNSSGYMDYVATKGKSIGEIAIMEGTPNQFDAVAQTDGLCFTIDVEPLQAEIGNLKAVLSRGLDVKKLKLVKVFADTIQRGQDRAFGYLARQIRDVDYPKGSVLFNEGDKLHHPAFYFVRTGKVRLTSSSGRNDVVDSHFYFGEDQMMADVNPGMLAGYTATVEEDATLGILSLLSCRKVMNTKHMGENQSTSFDSIRMSGTSHLKLEDLERIRVLGAGTFGQVWLVSRTGTDNKKHAYALKIQSKYELFKNGQAKGVVLEKQVMAQLNHPFLGGLVASFQDTNCIYMVMQLIQGGELYSVMQTTATGDQLEKEVQFYIAGIAEGLAYMHRRGFVYRDLKPENVLIDSDGYPVIVDFGFAKFVVDKTYTLCGTPLYLAPEVILNRGHNYGADHWSLGVLVFEMLEGYTPFYEQGMDQSQLFRAIVKCQYKKPTDYSNDAQDIINGLLQRHPTRRLGNLASGLDGITQHPWLSSIDHDDLIDKQIKAPHVPAIQDPFDGSNFEDWGEVEDKATKKYPALKASQEKLFEEF